KLGISIPTIDRTSTVMLNETSTPQITYYNSTTIFIQESLFDTLDYIPVSEILDVTITNSTEDCKNGCEISFYLQYDDVPSGVDKFFILHDKNDDGIIDDTDILIPTIERITNYLLRISANINSFSTVALVGLPSGGGGDETAPDYQSASLGGGGSVVYLDDINFENSIEKSIIKVGEEYKLSISLYENSGPDAIQHISLYTDLRGFEREVHHSDAYIRWDKGAGLATHDPQNLFQETDIFMLKNGQNLEVEFTIIFNKPMQESDLVVRAWDVNRNSWDTRFVKALEVIPAEILDMPLIAEEISLDMETFEKWSSLSGDSISDSDLLASMGLEGKSIPEWYKIIVLPWIQEGLISLEEFVNSIKFFEARGLLG
nr:hypothetical protein [Candidatus Dadabacteria bacterium]